MTGYSTNFTGQFDLDKPLNAEQITYLKAFSQTRRMKRDAEKARLLCDPVREAVGLPIGKYGEFFVGHWVPTNDGLHIGWDGGEKFYEYVAWLEYLDDRFLKPWGITISGTVGWQGEDSGDRGRIVVKGGKISGTWIE